MYKRPFTILFFKNRLWIQNQTFSLFLLKDIIPKEISLHLVYKFTCSCCNATYCGESEKHLFVRASEQLCMVPLTAKRVNNSQKSDIFDHILLKSHDTSFEDFAILLKENNKFKLHLKESFLIKCDRVFWLVDWFFFTLYVFSYMS